MPFDGTWVAPLEGKEELVVQGRWAYVCRVRMKASC